MGLAVFRKRSRFSWFSTITGRFFIGLGAIILFSSLSFLLFQLTKDRFETTFSSLVENRLPELLVISQLMEKSEQLSSLAPEILMADNQIMGSAIIKRVKAVASISPALFHTLNQSELSKQQIEGLVEGFDKISKNLFAMNQVQQRIMMQENEIRIILTRLRRLHGDLLPMVKDIKPIELNDNMWFLNVQLAIIELLSLNLSSHFNQHQLLEQRYNQRLNHSLKALVTVSPARKAVSQRILDELKRHPREREEGLLSKWRQIFFDKNSVQGHLDRNRFLMDKLHQDLKLINAKVTGVFYSAKGRLLEEWSELSNILTWGLVIMILSAVMMLLYLKLSVIERLVTLRNALDTHVRGEQAPLPLEGRDEVAEMAHAVEFFLQAISERQEKLEEARREAEKANQIKSRFLANISHELRTPLNTILGYGQLFQRSDCSTQELQKGLLAIDSSGGQLLALIDDLLDFTRMESDSFELVEESFYFHHFLEMTADALSVQFQQKGLVYTTHIDPDLPIIIRSDKKRLRQVLLNLLANACKYTSAGQVTFLIHRQSAPFFEGEEERVSIRFEIRDTGEGIDASDQAFIFKPFFKLNSGRGYSTGAGLGLAISQELVRMMGSRIQLKSKKGEGSAFFFHLEFALGREELVELPRQTAKPVSYEGKTMRLLIVDDIQQNRDFFQDLFLGLGFEVDLAENGRQGVEMAQALRPDLILMDRIMPVMDGFQAVERLRLQPSLSSIPVILITAATLEITEQQLGEMGFDGVLPKPVDIESLLGLVGELLGLVWQEGTDTKKPLASPDFLEKNSAFFPKMDAAMALPDAASLKRLQHYARAGKLLKIQRWCEQIGQQQPAAAGFVEQISQMASRYQDEQIDAWVGRYLERLS
ncbi:MAG: response regulator [Magnetococcales bacterium]|nr:response regulator [Magnetococcales bacterium]